MNAAELRQHSRCGLCSKPVLATGLPLFWRVTVERFGVDLAACKRQDGLAAMLGSNQLAQVMGPGEEVAKPMGPPVVTTVCETCALQASYVAQLGESV